MTSPDIVGAALVVTIVTIAGIIAAVGVYVAIVISLAITRLIRESRQRQAAITPFCYRCDLDPAFDCDCGGDCGRRHCKWATTINDATFRAALDEMLGTDD